MGFCPTAEYADKRPNIKIDRRGGGSSTRVIIVVKDDKKIRCALKVNPTTSFYRDLVKFNLIPAE